jgi:hypothetical protein
MELAKQGVNRTQTQSRSLDLTRHAHFLCQQRNLVAAGAAAYNLLRVRCREILARACQLRRAHLIW